MELEKQEHLASKEDEVDASINYGPDYYREIGSPPIFFATGPADSDEQFTRGNVADIVFCKVDNGSLESLQVKLIASMLGRGQ